MLPAMRFRPTAFHPRSGGVVAAAALVAATACGGDTTAPKPRAPLTIVAGADVTDTIQARPVQALVVEVREPDGSPAVGVVVRFRSLVVSDSTHPNWPNVYMASLTSQNYSTFITDQTDASGRAKALVQLGAVAAPAALEIAVPELGLADTARYTVKPGNAARVELRVRDTVLYTGAQYTIGALSTDRFFNPRPGDPITFTAATSNVSVSSGGVVSATAVGRGVIAVQTGVARDTARASVVPHGTIVYVQDSPRGVAVVNLDGSGHRFLHAVSDWSVFPQWSSDGTSVVMYEGDPSSNARLTLVGMDSTARTVLQIPRDTLVGMAWPRFAPNGSIYFGGVTSGSGQTVWRVNADGTGLLEIPGAHGNYNYQHPAPSPDGRTLLIDNAQSTNGLLAIDLASGATTSVGSGTWPSYSPDGSKIAYVAGYGIMVADANGANARPLTSAPIYVQGNSAPSWTADGQWVFVPGSPSVLVRVSDGSTMPLAFTGSFTQPSLR